MGCSWRAGQIYRLGGRDRGRPAVGRLHPLPAGRTRRNHSRGHSSAGYRPIRREIRSAASSDTVRAARSLNRCRVVRPARSASSSQLRSSPARRLRRSARPTLGGSRLAARDLATGRSPASSERASHEVPGCGHAFAPSRSPGARVPAARAAEAEPQRTIGLACDAPVRRQLAARLPSRRACGIGEPPPPLQVTSRGPKLVGRWCREDAESVWSRRRPLQRRPTLATG